MGPYADDDTKRKRRKRKFLGSTPGVNGSLITTIDGLPIASVLPQGLDETRVAAMTASLLSLAKNSIKEMEIGEFDQLYVKGSDGYILTFPAGPEAALTISTSINVRLGLIFLDCKRASERIAKIYRGDFDDNNDNGYLPFPFISMPPSPPGDLGIQGEPQTKRPIIKEDVKYESYCKHCGANLPKGQTICHVCGNKVD
ncbi:MAG: roadblock/LC7 domain-containing protein [Candidatus Lokiarchaeia archaeon]|nr:roadblock/LC7 domain-containing protein [Candidatus Lokiarchaeia archaeon]